MIYAFEEYVPVVAASSFVHPQATVVGNVIIGQHCYIGPGAVLRGDFGQIILEDGCNVQESCTIHMFPGETVLLREGAHIGHGAVIHGATIGQNCLVGMNAVIMDHVELGDGSIVGALSLVKQGEKIPAGVVMAGNPARVIREVSEEMAAWKTEGTRLYQLLPDKYLKTLREVEPLREVPADRPMQRRGYAPKKSG